MIKVNLLLVKKKKKKAKPIPAFLISTIGITLIVGAILAYLWFFFNSRIEARQVQIRKNEKRIKELELKIKAVEDYERRNALFKQRKAIIEQLGKNKSIPVKILDQISALLPDGVWVKSMGVKGNNITISCTGFTNTDVVNYVNNLKKSKLFTNIFLRESVQAKLAGYSLYNFTITLQVKA